MVDIITDEELASLLQVSVTPGLTLIVEKVNGLITEYWEDPADPVPTRVWGLAVTIASRALANPKGLSSWTRSWDDINRTERMEGDALKRLGLYITADEIDLLNGVDDAEDPPLGIGTISTRTRDQVCPPRGWPC